MRARQILVRLAAGATVAARPAIHSLYAIPEVPFYSVQTVAFTDRCAESALIENTDGLNSWAGADYGAVRTVVMSGNADSERLGGPRGGFRGEQGIALVCDITDESGNDVLCALSGKV